MQHSKILTAVIILFTFISCKKDTESVDQPATALSRTNVSYGSSSQQTMDMYLPAGRTSQTKVMILVHGGAWNQGDKAELTEYVDSFKRRMPDYAIFNINYRLATTSATVFPTQENDVKAALQFIYDHTSEYSISQKYVMTGVSAGAHLSLLQAYKYSVPVKLKAVVSFFGPTDMTDMYNNPTNPLVSSALVSVIGATPTQDPGLYSRSSPVNFVGSTSPPTILLHGGIDPLVRPSQAVMLQTKLQAAGVINRYVYYPNEGHGWFGATLSDSFDKIQAFLQANVQ